MRLRNKIFSLVFLLFCLFGLAGYYIRSHVILPSFLRLEQKTALNNMVRVIEALNRDLELLIPSANDWATRDDTYRFIADQQDEFIRANLQASSVLVLNINFLGIYDAQGRKVWGLAYDSELESVVDLGELSMDSLATTHPVLRTNEPKTPIAGILPTAAGPLIIASRSILTSSGQGPSRGRVVMGRFLNEALLAKVGEQTRLKVNTIDLEPDTNFPVEEVKLIGHLTYTPIEMEESNSVTFCRTTLLDLNAQPVLRIQVATRRDIMAQGAMALDSATLFLGSALTLLLSMILLLLRRSVFIPVSKLISQITTLDVDGDLNSRLNIHGSDEIGILGREFNQMIGRLADARRKLIDQSYLCGMAETASGVLHNIGNAVTPLGLKLTKIQYALRQAPAAEVETAMRELADPATPVARRADLARFMELAAGELAAALRRTGDEVETVKHHLEHVQMILDDQRRFSKAQRVIESVSIGSLIHEAAKMLPEELSRHMRVEIDSSLADAGQVRAARTALRQVIDNILFNAAESIQENGQHSDTGLMHLQAAVGNIDGQAAIHLEFHDNGAGISPESMPHIFANGFTTKSRGSGMGLHWSANTVAAMGGRLWAQSPGRGQGACIHLLLPLSEPDAQPEEAAA